MASEAEIKGFFIELDADGDGWINQTTDLQAVRAGRGLRAVNGRGRHVGVVCARTRGPIALAGWGLALDSSSSCAPF